MHAQQAATLEATALTGHAARSMRRTALHSHRSITPDVTKNTTVATASQGRAQATKSSIVSTAKSHTASPAAAAQAMRRYCAASLSCAEPRRRRALRLSRSVSPAIEESGALACCQLLFMSSRFSIFMGQESESRTIFSLIRLSQDATVLRGTPIISAMVS